MYRRSIEYRFVETCMLTWKFRMNVKPKDAESHYKKAAFLKFQGMPEKNQKFKEIMDQSPEIRESPRSLENIDALMNAVF